MLVRQVTRVELAGLYGTSINGAGESIYKVWFGGTKYEYVWAKDELEAFKRATRDETNRQS